MNENAPPAGTGATSGTGDAARGLPYYEKLRRDLRETLQKKRVLDQSLVSEVSFCCPSNLHCRSGSSAVETKGFALDSSCCFSSSSFRTL